MRDPLRAIVVTPDAWRFSTRGKKAAVEYAKSGPTRFVGMSAAGRTGRWDTPGESRQADVSVYLVPMRHPETGTSRWTQVTNLLRSYVPALARQTAQLWTSPAQIVHVTSSPLAPLGVLHHLRHGSQVVVDITERPGEVATPGSLASVFALAEGVLLRVLAPRIDLATVPVAGVIPTLHRLGLRRVRWLRNAPLRDWRADYRDPAPSADGTLRIAVLGSIFEGRGYEVLIRALGRIAGRRPVEVLLAGPGRQEYVDSLRALARAEGVDALIRWLGPIPSSEVSETYLRAHIGLVLYESLDPGNDGLSNKILECVATGRPVLAGDLPENRRFVTENAVGYLTGVTVTELTEAILALPAVPELVDLARRCRALGDRCLHWEAEFAGVLAELDALAPRTPARV